MTLFDITQIRTIDAGFLGKLHLGQAVPVSLSCNSATKAFQRKFHEIHYSQ